MRVSLIQLVVMTSCVSLVCADPLLGQGVLDTKVSVNAQDQSVGSFLLELEKQASVNFTYSPKSVESSQKVTVRLEDKSLRTVLETVFGDEMVWVVKKNAIILKRSKHAGARQDQARRIAEVSITGTVVDEAGLPLPGVNILEKGTTNGTTTDVAGKYNLSVAENATIIFSFIGFTTQEISVEGRTTIDITMKPDVQALSEVVVVGYSEQRKADLTGSVSSVEADDIQKLAVPTLNQAIQGRAAGVFVSRNNGSPGANAEIFIRGVGSIQGSDPLWIIDGVRTSPGSSFNMNDVESIDILKDASAAAIYGSAAANGVIIVTTKRGKKGQPKIAFNGYTGISSPLGLPTLLNTQQYALIKNEAYDQANVPRIAAFADPNTLPAASTDWIDVLYGKGRIQNYDVSISGGGENSNFYVSGNYFREDGTLIDTWFERFSLRANSDFTVGKRIRLGESLNVIQTQNDPQDISTTEWIRATPAMPVFDPANPYGGYGAVPRNEYAYEGGNPLASELRVYTLNKTYRINSSLYVEVDIVDGLKLRTNFGANFDIGNDRRFRDKYFGGGGNRNDVASLSRSYSENIRLLGNAVLSYAKDFNGNAVSVLAGYEAIRTDMEGFTGIGSAFIGNVQVLSASSTASRNALGYNDKDRLLSQFARLEYSYEGKYLFTANVRRDGDSKFGENYRFGVFPSFSAGWRLSDEAFLKDNAVISDLKLRASWGILGNSVGLQRYLYESSFTPDATLYTFGTGQDVVQGLRPSRFPNASIKWEELETFNIGLDLGLMEDRMAFTADYYVKNTNDLLLSVGIPRSAGYLRHAWFDGLITNGRLNPVVNIGQMQNRGLELAVSYRETLASGFTLNLSANASRNLNEVKKLNEDDKITTGTWDGAGFVSLTEVGQPLGYFNGYVVDGIFQEQSEVDALNAASPTGVYQQRNTGAGDFKYRDIGRFNADGDFVAEPDGLINAADKTMIGNPWPKWIYGFNANLSFKNFDLSMFFQGVHGVDRYNSFKSFTHNLFGDYNMTTGALDRWTPENPSTTQPRIHLNDPNQNRSTVSSYYVEDGSYLRLKNVQLGYAFPAAVLSKAAISRARVYASVDNLLTFTRYSGIDPEFNRGSNTDKGIDNGIYPQSRTFIMGIQLEF